MVGLRQLVILGSFLMVGCNSATEQQNNQESQTTQREIKIIGGQIDWKTNTITDDATGKVYSLADQKVNEATMEAYYPSEEEISNKQPEVLRLVKKTGAEMPEEAKGQPPFKLDGNKLLMMNKQFEFEEVVLCPGNNSILEIIDEEYPENNLIYQFSNMKWKQLKELPENIKRLN